MATLLNILKDVWSARAPLFTCLVLVVCLPIIYTIPDTEMKEPARKCMYILLVMAILWLTEALPIPITSLIPIVMFPMTGVMTAAATSSAYISDTTMLFLGGLVVAVAVEESNLHKRISMIVIRMIGSDPKWVMAGLMVPTWFISMWISNTATASMMIPIADAVLKQIKTAQNTTPDLTNPDLSNVESKGHDCDDLISPSDTVVNKTEGIVSTNYKSNGIVSGASSDLEPDYKASTYNISEDTSSMPENKTINVQREDASYNRLCRGLTLCIAYASNIGGIATLTGSPPNLVLKGIADEIYKTAQRENGTDPIGSPISFSNWMTFALPLSALTLLLSWALLVIFFICGRGCCSQKKEQSNAIKKVVKDEWIKLGKVSLAEIEVLILFIFLAILWISRDPKESPGWVVWFCKDFVSDSTSAMLVAILLFILPKKIPNVFCLCKKDTSHEPSWIPLLTWEQVNKKLPWGILLLLGGGFALAKGVQSSLLDKWLAEKLQGFADLDIWILNLILCFIVAAATEVTSNTATATLLMPILSELAISVGVSPLYLMISAATATSFAFMLPVATPPNAIVFSCGYLRVVDMATVGFFMNIIAVAVLTLAVNTWGKSIYGYTVLEPIFHK